MTRSDSFRKLVSILLFGWLMITNAQSVQQVAPAGCKRKVWSYNTPFEPSEQRKISAKRGKMHVVFATRRALPKRPRYYYCFVFEAKDAKSGRSNEFTLETETAQVDDLDVASPSRTRIIGRLTREVSAASIIAWETRYGESGCH
jgi:hypothetical protein